MASKSFKLRISKVINTTLQSCRSLHPSDLPKEPLPPPLPRLSPKYSKLITVDGSDAHHHHLCPMSSSDPTISSAFIRSYTKSTDQFKWQKEENWHVVAKIYDDNHTVPARRKTKIVNLPTLPSSVPAPPSTSRRKMKKKKNPTISTFSGESERFSNEIKRNKHRKSKKPSKQSSQSQSIEEIFHRESSTAEIGSPARLSMFKKLIPCSVEGKVKESFAIVKKSEDPYEDFKRSMVDMILEKQIFEDEDLEQLLLCFLSLNSRQYHFFIFKAFSDISEAIFSACCR